MASSGGSPIRRLDEAPLSGDAAANILSMALTADGQGSKRPQTSNCAPVILPAHVFAPRHFAGILAKIWSGNMMVLADFGAAEPGEITFRPVRAGAIRTIRLAVIDPLHLERSMQIVPSPRLVRMDDAPTGDAPANDRDGLGLVFHDGGCQGLPSRSRIATTQRRLPFWCLRRRRSIRAAR